MENIIKSYFQEGKWKQTSIYRVIGSRDVKLRKGVFEIMLKTLMKRKIILVNLNCFKVLCCRTELPIM